MITTPTTDGARSVLEHYPVSTDYPLMIDLMQDHAIICLWKDALSDEQMLGTALIDPKSRKFMVVHRDRIAMCDVSPGEFLQNCREHDVAFIPPRILSEERVAEPLPAASGFARCMMWLGLIVTAAALTTIFILILSALNLDLPIIR